SLEGNFTASDTGLVIDSTTVVWNGLRADMKGSVGLRDWKIEDASPIKADFDAENGNIPKLLALAGRADVPVTGTVGAKGQVEGTIGDPHVSADFTLASGQVEGEPFDSIAGQARYV